MARNARQSKILSIISVKNIGTQEELVAELALAGFDVTQATVSRDIKELGLIKTPVEFNRYKYVTQQNVEQSLNGKLLAVFREAVISVVAANNLVVVKTIVGGASAVAGAIEQLALPQVVGVLADRNTVLAVTLDNASAAKVADRLTEIQYNS